MNTSGINTHTTAGSSTMTHAEALQALSKLEEDNVTSANSVFIMHPTNYSTIAATAVDSGSGRFVIENGVRYLADVSFNPLWQRLERLFWAITVIVALVSFGCTDIVVDNMTEAPSAKVFITQHQMADVEIRHAVGFFAITLTA